MNIWFIIALGLLIWWCGMAACYYFFGRWIGKLDAQDDILLNGMSYDEAKSSNYPAYRQCYKIRDRIQLISIAACWSFAWPIALPILLVAGSVYAICKYPVSSLIHLYEDAQELQKKTELRMAKAKSAA